MQKLVSVIIPCFNAERWIAETIDSCLKQTYPYIEIIVIDDFSTDNSLEIIKSYGDKVIWERLSENKGATFFVFPDVVSLDLVLGGSVVPDRRRARGHSGTREARVVPFSSPLLELTFEVGVFSGLVGSCFREETVDAVVKAADDFRMVGGEVVVFAGIRLQIEKLRASGPLPTDEFPFSFADGSAGRASLISPMRVVPDEGAVAGLFGWIFEIRQKGNAVLVLLGE